MICPVCKRKIVDVDDANCPRCKTDLTVLLNLIELSKKSISEGTRKLVTRKFDAAKKKFQTAIEINNSKKAMHGKAISFLCKKDFKNSLKLYLKCKSNNPKNPPNPL